MNFYAALSTFIVSIVGISIIFALWYNAPARVIKSRLISASVLIALFFGYLAVTVAKLTLTLPEFLAVWGVLSLAIGFTGSMIGEALTPHLHIK